MPLCALLAACASPQPPRRPADAQTASKASLFGDAALVPTRQGERARAELAVSAEVQRVVAVLPAVQTVAVSVRLPATRGDADTPARAAVSVIVAAEADAHSVRRDVEAVTRTWLGEEALIETLVAARPDAPDPDELPWPMLTLALLGLGASLGVTVDRAFDRRRRATRARAT